MVLLECRRRGRGRSPTVDANVTLRDPGDSAIGVRGNAGSEPESASMAGATTTPWVRPDELCARKDKKRHRGSSLKRRVRIRIPTRMQHGRRIYEEVVPTISFRPRRVTSAFTPLLTCLSDDDLCRNAAGRLLGGDVHDRWEAPRIRGTAANHDTPCPPGARLRRA